MIEDKMDHQEQIQTTVSATFAAPLVPTDIELGDAAIEVQSPPLVEQDDSVLAGESVGQTTQLTSVANIINEMMNGAEAVIGGRLGSIIAAQ
jgi:hypothetical protein